MRSNLSILDHTTQAIGVLFRNFSPVPICLRLFFTFSSLHCSVSGFMWRSLIHLVLSFVHIGYQSPIRFRNGKDPLQICWWPFCLIDSVFWLAEALQFYEVPFVDSRSYSTSNCCSIQEFSPCAHIFEVFPQFLLYKFQCLWFYVEFLNPLRFDLSIRRQEWINSHSST